MEERRVVLIQKRHDRTHEDDGDLDVGPHPLLFELWPASPEVEDVEHALACGERPLSAVRSLDGRFHQCVSSAREGRGLGIGQLSVAGTEFVLEDEPFDVLPENDAAIALPRAVLTVA